MPLHIDPRWEYWVPDPEVEELLKGEQEIGVTDRFWGSLPDRSSNDGCAFVGNTGFRFGHKYTDRYWDTDGMGKSAEDLVREYEGAAPRHGALVGRPGRGAIDRNRDLFCYLWRAGAPTKQMMEVFGITSLQPIKRAVRGFKLAPRRVGNRRLRPVPIEGAA